MLVCPSEEDGPEEDRAGDLCPPLSGRVTHAAGGVQHSIKHGPLDGRQASLASTDTTRYAYYAQSQEPDVE